MNIKFNMFFSRDENICFIAINLNILYYLFIFNQ